MDDNDLIIIGRIAVIWGQIIFHLDHILLHLLGGLTRDDLEQYPLKSLNRKLQDLGRELSKPAQAKVRKSLMRAHSAIGGLASDRNVIFHGLWGHWKQQAEGRWVSASKSYTRDLPFFRDDLPEFYERLVSASQAVNDAHWILLVDDGEPPQNRNRKQLWSDGPPSPQDRLAQPRDYSR